TDQPDHERHLVLPFAWNDVHLYAGAATTLRVHIGFQGQDTISMRLADTVGNPVASVGSWVARPVGDELRQSGSGVSEQPMFRLTWEVSAAQPTEASVPVVPVESVADVRAVAGADDVPDVVVLHMSGESNGDDCDAAAVHALSSHVLEVVQAYLAEPRLQDTSLLAVTHGAVSVARPTELTDLSAATANALLRSAQAENPGRITLLDTDDTIPLNRIAATLNTLDEPQLAIRQGTSHVPR
ncbi:hypothetical protein ADK35_12745, partial [Streptomyces viridochromogenes]